ncbi:MAG TPA: ATPase domain-containing protein [Candidatus Limnocylindria bacterium]|nr:ATPase domain-containing protein [Candidatus Limnocylindria bacterium]
MKTVPTPSHPRCLTGIDGLDDILAGGLPRDRLYLVMGEPGVGKTTLALQFLLAGAAAGEKSLYVTLSETQMELSEVAHSHGWDLSKLSLYELRSLQEKIRNEADTTFFSPSEVQLNRTTEALMKEVERVRPVRVVLDSLSELRLMSETALRYRRQFLELKQYFSGRNCTVLTLDDGSGNGSDEQVESLAHGVIKLTKQVPDYGVTRRQIRVEKLRGVPYRQGNHDVLLRTGGVVVFPRLVAAEHPPEKGHEGRFSSGNPGLDTLVGGGLDRGTSTIFMGPAGAGKSTLATSYAYAAAERGEKVLFFSFDETIQTTLTRAAGLCMELKPHLDSGRLELKQIDPAEVSPGELAYAIRRSVESEESRMVIIDSINGFLYAMTDHRHLMLHLHELLSFLNQRGVATLMVLTQQGMVGQMQGPVDITYLADAVVMLRYFEANGAVRQAISVMKKRSGPHERTIREFAITPRGIAVGAPLTGFQGILTGTPVLTGERRDELKAA